MKKFLDHNFLLSNTTAETLYHEHASKMPIIDYHCHLSPKDIAENRQFENLTQAWLEGDHYKWRALRANGINEKFCTGQSSDFIKFQKWAETVPHTMRNPLYHWTHMELKQVFGINELLNPNSAEKIYADTNELLAKKEFGCQGLLRKFNVEVVCTTDDPIDSLEYHQAIAKSDFSTQVLPTFRPDKAFAIENPKTYRKYLTELSKIVGFEIDSFESLVNALQSRVDFFHANGCRLSDHGFTSLPNADFNTNEIIAIFKNFLSGKSISNLEVEKFKCAVLEKLGQMYHEKNWTQQFHIGAIRNSSSRMFNLLGADAGFDSIGNPTNAEALASMLDRWDKTDQLAKTILYNLNPSDNYMYATMIANFQDGNTAGKIQFGSGWWFLDQKEGIEMQLNALSSQGLLSRFVGMLTDSRSFLSFPRHDYFRRILCNLIGKDVEEGLLPNDILWLGEMVENICYYNAKNYFKF
ncbi:glucuronate isomerase [Aureibacter tunicatorum]|uniref:Uronate isomerase n=1 Tax=Aureibacter tunicatorum TaxID=866807 RepID=A0AAE3XK49_9BACT|nr:glucuronate isomerase [Aureibacter tunicatorum]MDR6239271.1 glucuronate isomerase [Aureibacter tunicatorum]BDD04804.1 uronate isomerase [Aureibacter tunicatorum]